jgi:hypothetical protein
MHTMRFYADPFWHGPLPTTDTGYKFVLVVEDYQ